MLHGVLVIDKPAGPTSHDVVAVVRRVTGQRRVGHTGTLDPFATGVLALILGRATRLSRFLTAAVKQYRAGIRLGLATDTYDRTGMPVGSAASERDVAAVTTADVTAVLARFRGTFQQAPPPFSAKRVAGTRAYTLARQQRDVHPPRVTVTVQQLEVVAYAEGCVEVDLVSSTGFYVRSLAHDFGQALGVGAHLEWLRRTASGGFTLAEAVTLDALVTDGYEAARRTLVPVDRLLESWPGARLTEQGVRRVAHGQTVGSGDIIGWLAARPASGAADAASLVSGADAVRLLAPDGRLVGLACGAPAGAVLLHPDVVLV